jgi:cell wall-associated NlpC family hydrolase
MKIIQSTRKPSGKAGRFGVPRAKSALAAAFALAALILASCASASGKKATEAAPEKTPGKTKVSSVRQALLNEGEKYIGRPYKSPPNAPANFDCSGFVSYVYKNAAAMNLSPASASYATQGKEVHFKDAKPGDVLVFVSDPGGKKISHVAMLYQKSGTGDLLGSWVIHAVSIPVTAATIKGDSTKDGVIISELGKGRGEYFYPRYLMTRRFVED